MNGTRGCLRRCSVINRTGSSSFIISRVSLIKYARNYDRVDVCSVSSSTSSGCCLALRASWFLSRCVAVTPDPTRGRVQMFGGGSLQRLELDDIVVSCQMCMLGLFPQTSCCWMFPGTEWSDSDSSSCLIIISHRRAGQYSPFTNGAPQAWTSHGN